MTLKPMHPINKWLLLMETWNTNSEPILIHMCFSFLCAQQAGHMKCISTNLFIMCVCFESLTITCWFRRWYWGNFLFLSLICCKTFSITSLFKLCLNLRLLLQLVSAHTIRHFICSPLLFVECKWCTISSFGDIRAQFIINCNVCVYIKREVLCFLSFLTYKCCYNFRYLCLTVSECYIMTLVHLEVSPAGCFS